MALSAGFTCGWEVKNVVYIYLASDVQAREDQGYDLWKNKDADHVIINVCNMRIVKRKLSSKIS